MVNFMMFLLSHRSIRSFKIDYDWSCIEGFMGIPRFQEVANRQFLIGSFSNSTSDDDVGAGGIVWILFYFDHIWVFALCTPSSSEVPVDLISPPNINCKNVLTEANSSLKSNFESCHLAESSR